MPGGTGADTVVSVLTWLRLMETLGARPTRGRLAYVYRQSWSAAFAETALAHTVASGLVMEDASGLHLTASGRQYLTNQADR